MAGVNQSETSKKNMSWRKLRKNNKSSRSFLQNCTSLKKITKSKQKSEHYNNLYV